MPGREGDPDVGAGGFTGSPAALCPAQTQHARCCTLMHERADLQHELRSQPLPPSAPGRFWRNCASRPRGCRRAGAPLCRVRRFDPPRPARAGRAGPVPARLRWRRAATAGTPLRERLTRDRGDKAELAARVCALLQPGQVVLLDAGSTNLVIAQQLPAALGLTVITNAPQIATAASLLEGTSVQLIGGRLASGGGAVGAEALAGAAPARRCVPARPCAVDGDTGVWAMDAEEATLKRAMVACSSRVIVAATTEKLVRGNWQIASLDEIDDLVLTTTAPPALAARFRAAGIAVHPTPLTVPLMSVANRARAEQHATRAAFFIPGFATALWATLVPFAKARTGINDVTLGLVLLCLGAGSLLAMPLSGVLARASVAGG